MEELDLYCNEAIKFLSNSVVDLNNFVKLYGAYLNVRNNCDINEKRDLLYNFAFALVNSRVKVKENESNMFVFNEIHDALEADFSDYSHTK